MAPDSEFEVLQARKQGSISSNEGFERLYRLYARVVLTWARMIAPPPAGVDDGFDDLPLPLPFATPASMVEFFARLSKPRNGLIFNHLVKYQSLFVAPSSLELRASLLAIQFGHSLPVGTEARAYNWGHP